MAFKTDSPTFTVKVVIKTLSVDVAMVNKACIKRNIRKTLKKGDTSKCRFEVSPEFFIYFYKDARREKNRILSVLLK